MLNIKKYREALDLTQTQVSQMLDVARTTYIGYENGTREMSYDTMKKLATILNVTIDDLLDFNVNKGSSKIKDNLIYKINKLSDKECEKIDFFVQAILTTKQISLEQHYDE